MNRGFKIVEETPDREYFTIIPNYIVNHSNIWEQSIYLVMKRMAGEGGSCYFSQGNIAKKLEVSRPKVNETIQKLIKRGWIESTGKKVGRTKSVNEYKIIDLWKLNVDFYRKDKQAVNQVTSSVEAKVSPQLQEAVNQVYTEEEHIEEDTNNTSLQTYGDPGINEILEYLKTKLEIPDLDGSVKLNRQYAHLLIQKSKTGPQGVKWLVDQAASDGWWRNRITSTRDLWNNKVKILSRQRSDTKVYAMEN